jgi:hypothetical protein
MTKVTEGATPQRRRPGRPVRGNRPAMVRITVNLDPHLHAMLEGIADHVGIPASRVLNAILQTFHDAEYSSVDYGFVPGKESNMRIMSLKKWPQRPDTDVEGQS